MLKVIVIYVLLLLTEWWYGPVLCKMFPYLHGVAVSASVNTLAAVAIERWASASFCKYLGRYSQAGFPRS